MKNTTQKNIGSRECELILPLKTIENSNYWVYPSLIRLGEQFFSQALKIIKKRVGYLGEDKAPKAFFVAALRYRGHKL